MTRYYLWQDQLKLAAELNGAGQLIKRYVYTNNEHSPDYMLYQGNYFVFIKDHRGSILNVLNARTGQVMQSLKYSDWGKVIQDSNPGYQPFGFAGGMYETDTGLVHFGAREYDPEVGKWISKDPILFEGGDTNLYGYVLNDPVNFIDPDGKFAIALIPALPAIGAAIEGIVVAGSAIVAGWGISEGINYYNQKRPFPQGPPDGSVTLPNGDKRIYDGNGNPVRDEDWGHDRGHGVPHVHDWIPKPGGGFSRGPGRPPKPGECK